MSDYGRTCLIDHLLLLFRLQPRQLQKLHLGVRHWHIHDLLLNCFGDAGSDLHSALNLANVHPCFGCRVFCKRHYVVCRTTVMFRERSRSAMFRLRVQALVNFLPPP